MSEQQMRIEKRPSRMTVITEKTRAIFLNVCILCGASIALATTIKVIMSLFN